MGKWFNIGDRVRCIGGGGDPYEYTVQEISSDGYIWGSELPKPYYESNGCRMKNYHNPRPRFTQLVPTLNKKIISKHKMI